MGTFFESRKDKVDLQFSVLFNSISVISRQWEGNNERHEKGGMCSVFHNYCVPKIQLQLFTAESMIIE